jgi:plastocyanin
MAVTSRTTVALCSALALTLVLVGCGPHRQEQLASASSAQAPAPSPTMAASEPAAPAVPGPTGQATVAGAVTFDGPPPALQALDMSGDPNCVAKHSGPVPDNALVVGSDNHLANVFVYVKSGLPANAAWPAPKEPVVVDQRGCVYAPHVTGVMVGQAVRFLNSDDLLHNVHGMAQVNPEFNEVMPSEVTEIEEQFAHAEGMFRVRCDVHPWMYGYVGVLRHPFFAVTGADGAFTLRGLPAGTYTVEAWHERLGTQQQSVTLTDGGNAALSFRFHAAPTAS